MSDAIDSDSAHAFSPLEEEFFREGDAISAAASDEAVVTPALPGRLSRLFKRTPRPVTEPRPVTAPPVIETPADDDDWDWKIAIARSRHSTAV